MWRFLMDCKLTFASPENQLSEAVRRWSSSDKDGALRWGRRAAKRLPIAKVIVAQWLRLGKGEREAREAISLLTDAAEAGSWEAMRVLGASYLFGEGVAKNPQKAITLTRRRADEGDVEGQIAMVRYFTLGEYCEPNVEEARHYATLAAAAGRSEILAALVKDLQGEASSAQDDRRTGAAERVQLVRLGIMRRG